MSNKTPSPSTGSAPPQAPEELIRAELDKVLESKELARSEWLKRPATGRRENRDWEMSLNRETELAEEIISKPSQVEWIIDVPRTTTFYLESAGRTDIGAIHAFNELEGLREPGCPGSDDGFEALNIEVGLSRLPKMSSFIPRRRAMESKYEDTELQQHIRRIWEHEVPFNKALKLKIESMSDERVEMSFDMREELIGNYFRGSLHGGVVSAALDATGGLVAFMGLVTSMKDKPIEEKMDRFSRMGTIDLRVDYLRPGIGKHFRASGFILRLGNRVAVTRMELHNDEANLLAVGTGAYVVA